MYNGVYIMYDNIQEIPDDFPGITDCPSSIVSNSRSIPSRLEWAAISGIS